ncbi:alpha/beta hydrolase family protein [Vulcanisaeta thermophila]|uniref:alpha/beta hydrolase family protein n=1 Tax=Vulcanisaeta thermophila TaxID=867917 RepID=UPI0008533C5F|nr:alpha/beta fold hydrolase [Vulcanisaeta thermophila]
MKALALHGYGSSPEKINWLVGPLRSLGLEVITPGYTDFNDGLRKSEEVLKSDNDTYIVAGHSMGGSIALLLASMYGNVRCVISVSGPTDRVAQVRWLSEGEPGSIRRRTYEELLRGGGVDEDFLRGTSPINYIKPGMPPVLFIHGTEDELVPIWHPEIYIERARGLGNVVELVKVEGMRHTPRGRDIHVIARAIEDFVKRNCWV